LAVPAILVGFLVAIAVGFFVVYNAFDSNSQNALEESQKQISELKKELSLMRDEIYQEQDDLYIALDELEVSIHSLEEKKPDIRVFSKPQIPTHESELRRWRYLGASQMGISHQAYFHTGKSHLVFEKGAQVLGEWRLSNIEKGLVTLTHSQGKSMVLKASKGP
jgi:TolA-binding protein